MWQPSRPPAEGAFGAISDRSAAAPVAHALGPGAGAEWSIRRVMADQAACHELIQSREHESGSQPDALLRAVPAQLQPYPAIGTLEAATAGGVESGRWQCQQCSFCGSAVHDGSWQMHDGRRQQLSGHAQRPRQTPSLSFTSKAALAALPYRSDHTADGFIHCKGQGIGATETSQSTGIGRATRRLVPFADRNTSWRYHSESGASDDEASMAAAVTDFRRL